MKNLKTNAEMPNAEAQEIIFIELKKLPKIAGSLREWWLKFLAVKTGKELDMIATQAPVLERARERLVGISADEKLKFEMDMLERANYDYNSRMAKFERMNIEAIEKSAKKGMAKGMAKGMKKGMAKGMAKGIAKGISEARAEDARKMKAEGCDNAFIAKITGLSAEQIERM
jgi:predicted transposase/invertase (TIGR01784 family)